VTQDQAAPKYWLSEIGKCWRQQVNSPFTTGDALLRAQAALRPRRRGAFRDMVKKLPFGIDVAQKLMKVASDARLTAPVRLKLPASYSIVYELTRLSDERFDQALREGRIHPSMHRSDAEKLVQAQQIALLAEAAKQMPPTRQVTRVVYEGYDPAELHRRAVEACEQRRIGYAGGEVPTRQVTAVAYVYDAPTKPPQVIDVEAREVVEEAASHEDELLDLLQEIDLGKLLAAARQRGKMKQLRSFAIEVVRALEA
jgi:hypothetical protein